MQVCKCDNMKSLNCKVPLNKQVLAAAKYLDVICTKNNATIMCTFIMHQNALHDDTLVTSNFRLWLSHPLVDSNSAGSDSFFPFLNTELFSFQCAINVKFDAEESERCLNGCRRINRSY